MIPICTTIENIIHPAQLREDEYVESDGLVYRSKCRTPRQKRIEVMGRNIEPRSPPWSRTRFSALSRSKGMKMRHNHAREGAATLAAPLSYPPIENTIKEKSILKGV